MNVPNRLAEVVTGHSRVVIVALLLLTALVGAGMPMVDDDSSLDQFESESDEAEAFEEINERFVIEDDDAENTTTVQLITRGDNVISQQSLIESLELQQTIHENESLNATLVDEDPITGVENIVATTAISEDRIDALEDRADEIEEREEELEEWGDDLEERGEELEERGEELEERGESIEEDAAELEERQADLEEDQAELEERTGTLEVALNETMALQAEYLEAEDDQEREEIEDDIEATRDAAVDEADLDGEQTETFTLATEEVRTLVGLEAAYERVAEIPDDPEAAPILTEALTETRQLEEEGASDEEFEALWEEAGEEAGLEDGQQDEFEATAEDVRGHQSDLRQVESLELEAAFEEAFELGTAGVFAEEFAELEERGEELADDGDSLESRSDSLEEASEELEADSEELEEEQEELENEADELEEDAEALEEDFDELEEDGVDPTLEEQIEKLQELDEDEFEDVLTDTLDDNDGDDNAPALGFMSTDYGPGSMQADTRMTMLTQETATEDAMGGETDQALESQLDLRELADEEDQEYMVFGAGVITDEIESSMDDSLAIVGPLALLFVVIALSVAYRDPLDIALGVVGIIGVLIWTFGFMGWAGIAFNQMMIAVPVLLIGLSIDYAIHVFMRHREQRENDGVTGTVRGSMTIALAGVGVALVWVTATTAIGFLANLVSPIGPIREFGVVSSFGILSALIIFGALIPALKVEIDTLLESFGWNRRKRAFGTGEGRFTSALTVGSTAARRIPVVVIVAALLLTAGGVYGASQVDTSFEEEDFLADSPPEWTEHLPGGMAPGEYRAADDLDFVNENFQREDSEAQILIEGDITHDETLHRLSEAQDEAAEGDVVYTLPNGEADIDGPLSVMEDTAAQNESFNESFTDADTTGDGIPDQDIEALYDELFEVNEDQASTVLDRSADGEYEGALLTLGIQGDAGFDETTTELREIAATLDASNTGDERNLDADDGELNALATGDPIVSHIVEQDLLDTVLQSLMVTLVAVFAFLTVAYWLTGNGAALGTVTLLPVAFAVTWILGTMYLLDIPFNVLTGMITSLTIGLGVAYSIHISARYTLELERQGNAWSAMRTTVTGTGGALLGSAATTVGGFGTLAFAIFPALQQFGIITGLTITYSFLASVIVLPTLLILWTRYFGPNVSFDSAGTSIGAPTASDGGVETEPGADTETELDPGTQAGPEIESESESETGIETDMEDDARDQSGGTNE